MRVLVVDDTHHVRSMLGDMLELDGFEVVGRASSGQEAMELVRQTDPSVIVMDYKMPDMDGIQASKAIRELRPRQSIILYTAYLDEDIENRAREAGVTVCVGKVEGIAHLERRIRELVRDLDV